jgi:probable phosphoglycerate mutase
MSANSRSTPATAARILLCRHGNTFNPGDRVVMVGSGEDLPLTETGEAQARAVAVALRAAQIAPARVVCGTLRRTRRYAELLCAATAEQSSPSTDPRLNELDYGAWSGLSSAEIVAQFGATAWEQWHTEGVRPSGIDFRPSAAQVRDDTQAILNELRSLTGLSVIVTSNGRIREFGAQCPVTSEARTASIAPSSSRAAMTMRTGNVSVLVPSETGWCALAWDIQPSELKQCYLE